MILGCRFVWSEFLPALKYLDTHNLIGEISISDLIWLGIISLTTTVVFQNLSGLLEVTFLQAPELESGFRKAIITICQYVIIAIGIAVAFHTRTLSNPVIRMVFPVGIAYGSDINKAREILLDIARSQPEVLKDPEPVAIFKLFCDSALNFSLRCFVPRPELRLEMTHQINTLIHDRFVSAGIEIPYPRRDLHIRSIDPSVTLAQSTMPGE